MTDPAKTTRAPGFADVRAAAAGRWQLILAGLGVNPELLTRRHGPCPGCGGTDRFRFDDRDGSGSWYCNGGGDPKYGDGFDLLAHVHGWDKSRTLRAVAEYLGIKGATTSVAELNAAREARTRREIEEALVHELLVLLQVLNVRVSSRRLAASQTFRVLRPEWRPMTEGQLDRERKAVERIRKALEYLYAC